MSSGVDARLVVVYQRWVTFESIDLIPEGDHVEKPSAHAKQSFIYSIIYTVYIHQRKKKRKKFFSIILFPSSYRIRKKI